LRAASNSQEQAGPPGAARNNQEWQGASIEEQRGTARSTQEQLGGARSSQQQQEHQGKEQPENSQEQAGAHRRPLGHTPPESPQKTPLPPKHPRDHF